ncbi:B3 domain-containing transcription factor VRN1-like [Solanum pennellii]|uniref:B3 domain-containing transcription factor VRN1-like n=1 Tax=Solanum pennellii TaxID=28526 RepID=A0ABM1UYG2_SOLPN|nr:B3 domain-containing transcription factor VRN1-like [Solanum pennellii]
MTISKVYWQIGERNSSSTTTKINIFVQPKFYKIILYQHQCTRLRIPEDFAKRCCSNMLSPVYLEIPIGEVWEVEVQHYEGQIWLTKGW